MSEQYIRGRGLEGQPAKYVLVKNGNASAALVPGDVVVAVLNTTTLEVEALDATTALNNQVMGVVVGLRPVPGGGGSIPAGDYGYVQVSGFCPLVTTDTNITSGALLMALDGAVAGVATEGTHHPFGVALAADSGAVLSAAWIRNY